MIMYKVRAMAVELFIECITVRYLHKKHNDCLFWAQRWNMPRQCCMQSSDLEKVRTHLMSDVYTLVIDLILVRK